MCLLRFRFGKGRPNLVKKKLAAEDAAFTEAEDAQARYRLTAARLARATPPSGEFDVVLIGSGPGSLGCAAALSLLGYKCCVLEQGEQLGGGAHVFSGVGGYEFETGVHYLGNDEGMKGILNFLSCGRLELAPLGTPTKGGLMYDAVRIGDEPEYQFCGDEGATTLIAMLKERFPSADDLKRIDKFATILRGTMTPAYQADAAGFFVLKVPWILNCAAPLRWLRRLLQKTVMGGRYYKMTQQTTEDMLRSCDIEPSSLLGAVVIGQYGDAGMRPDLCSAMMQLGVMTHYLHGSCYPVGGSGSIPRKLNSVVIAGGGRSFVQARVASLLVDENGAACGVKLAPPGSEWKRLTAAGGDGNGSGQGADGAALEVRAKVVISGIGALRSYKDFLMPLKPQLPSVGAEAALAAARIAKATDLSVAFTFLFIGLDVPEDAPADVLDDKRNHNTWIYPKAHYTAMEKEIDNAKEPWSLPMPMFVACGSNKDTAWKAKHGHRKRTVVVLSQCPWAWVEPWAKMSVAERSKDPSYAAFKAKTKETLMEQGFRRLFPKFEPYVAYTDVGTPLSTNNFLGTDVGECYGRSATPARWLCPDLSPYTPLKNFYLTGQDIVTLGLTGAIAGGYLTANVIAGYGQWENVILQREICHDLGIKKLF